MKKKEQLAFIALLGCCIVWGTTFVVVKDVSTKVDPFLLSFLRNSIAACLLGGYLVLTGKTTVLQAKETQRYGLVLGALLGGIYSIQTFGLQFTSSSHSAFITCAAVIMVPLLLFILRWQALTWKQGAAILAVGVGLFIFTTKEGIAHLNIGDLLTLLGAVFCAVHIICSGIYVKKADSIGLIFYQFLFAALCSSVAAIVHGGLTKQWFFMESTALYSVLYLALLGTLFCYFVTVWAQKYLSTIYTALIFSLEPIFASIVAYVVLGECLVVQEYIGAAMILVGLFVYSFLPLPSKIEQEEDTPVLEPIE